MQIKAFSLACGALALLGCQNPLSKPSTDKSSTTFHAVGPSSCPLPAGTHKVKNVVLQSGVYEILILNAPSCVPQPVRFDKVMLAELEGPVEGAAAQLDVSSDKDPILHMTKDFKIEMVQVTQTAGMPPQKETSMWMPFLAGAAGAAVAGMAANALFRQPKYYMPPPQKPGMADVRGYGAAAPSYQGAVSDYQNRWKQPPPVAEKRSGSFFRTRDTTAAATPRSAPSAQSPQKSAAPQRLESREKTSFFQKSPQRNRSFFRRRSR